MLELSDIQSSQEELKTTTRNCAQHVTPAWIGGGISISHGARRCQDSGAGAICGQRRCGRPNWWIQQAERRVCADHPNCRTASSTLVANIQIVMPGEIARAHRHSAAALRRSSRAGWLHRRQRPARSDVRPGDLVLTPNWSWHDHANDTDAPMIWLDGLKIPRWCGCSRPGLMKSTTRRGNTLERPSTPCSGTTRCRRCGCPAASRCRGYRQCRRGDHPRIHQPGHRWTGDADDRLPHAIAAPRREDAGAPPHLPHELSRAEGAGDRWSATSGSTGS